MKKLFLNLCIFVFSIIYIIFPASSHAAVNPLESPNNKIGIHILFTHELEEAARLVNSSGGDYGYVTVVIQSGDKDIKKWQSFLDEAKRLHLIPIVRLATENYYFDTSVWRKPTSYDIVDFANFLNSLEWPYKNRYISVFNEVNRGDEWGGSLSPDEYAKILSYAVTVFKSKSPDFFMISAGLDNAAPNQYPNYMNQYDYLRAMNRSVPGIFNQLDGFASHSYPNPGFSQLPNHNSPMGANSFQYEKSLVKSLSGKDLPIFITETGWSTEVISHGTAAEYFRIALNTVWNDKSVVAVTPFLLQGSNSPFQKFSFLDGGGKQTLQYEAIKNYPKTKGSPQLTTKVLSAKAKIDSAVPETSNDYSEHEIGTKKIVVSKGAERHS
jgi:hypothetical protein